MSPVKAAIRREARAHRAEIASAMPDFPHRLSLYAESLGAAPDSVIAGYWPLKDEADPRQLMVALQARGAVLALPRIETTAAPLSFHRWQPGDELRDNPQGIFEPLADAPRAEPTIVFVPLLAFDRSGHRLGYGGGFYDRTLEQMRAKGGVRAIGIAYAGQEVDELPRQAHDRPLDAAVTEEGIRTFALT